MASEGRLTSTSSRFRNVLPITDQQGLQLFDKALRTSEPVIAPLLFRGPVPMVSTNTAHKTSTQSQAAIWRTNLAACSSSQERSALLIGLVRDEIARVLGYENQDTMLGPDRPLAALGFDSFTSVTLSNRLRVLTGLRSLPITLALDCDSLRALVRYLLARLEAELEAEPPTAIEDDAAPTTTEEDAPRPAGAYHGPKHSPNVPSIPGDVSPEVFQGLATIYRRMSQAGHYNAAAHTIISASSALPTFKLGPDAGRHATEPERLATGLPAPSVFPKPPPPLVLLPNFSPRIAALKGFRGSGYTALASAMEGERDVFELPHPTGPAVAEDLETLAALHASTIRTRFAAGSAVILAGFSAGGAVAHAVASQLLDKDAHESDGVRVAGLVLVDTYLDNVTGLDDREWPEWLHALPAMAIMSQAGEPDSSDRNLGHDLDLALAKMGAYFRLLARWEWERRPLPDALPTLFLRAQSPTPQMPQNGHDWRASWPRAGCTVDIPGNHLEIIGPAAAAEFLTWAKECADMV